MAPSTDGILLIDKCVGETSHGVVKKTRFALRGESRVKVGHAGTLDPFATGLLVILVGQGTKLSQFIMAGEKTYVATLELGVETDTMDPTGRVVATAPVPGMSWEQVEEAAQEFVGKLWQVPPAYSAVRCQGKRAYQLARKGQPVELKAREIMVHSIQILSMDLPQITLCIRCSSGTYVRRLVSDLGKALGTRGHLRSLRRVRSGPFDVGEALSSAEIGGQGPSLSRRIIPLGEALPHMRKVRIREKTAEKVRQGWQPAWVELMPDGEEKPPVRGDIEEGWIKLVDRGGLVAIGHIATVDGDGQGRFTIERVFSSQERSHGSNKGEDGPW